MYVFIRGIKYDFLFINTRKVLREVLKTEGVTLGFQASRETLRMSMNDKIMFDRYYCMNSTKHCENEEILTHYILQPHHILLREYAMHDSGQGQELII